MAWLQVEFSSILKPGPPAVALNPVNDARPVLNRPPGMAKVEVVTIRDKRGQTPSCRLRELHDSNGRFRTAEDLTECLSRIWTRDRFRG